MKKLFYTFCIAILVLIPMLSRAQPGFDKGKMFYRTSEFDSALTCFSGLIRSCGKTCHDTTLAAYRTYLGKTYSILEQYDRALAELQRAISIMDSAGNYNGKAFAMISLAEMYRKSFKLEKAMSEMKEVLDLNRKHPFNRNIEAYMYNRYAAIISEQENNPEEVYLYSKKVIELSGQTGDLDMKASSLNELGYYEENHKQYSLAANYYLKAYEIYKAQNNRIYIAQMLTNLARASVLNHKDEEGEAYLKQGIELTENTTWYDTRAGLLGFYSAFLYDRGRYKESRDILGKFIDAQLAKIQKQHSRTLVEMESKYELSKKSTEIELEKQKFSLAETEAAQKTQQRNYMAAGGIALAILLVLLFLSYRKIKNTNASLKAALLDREALLKEVNHRVKNNLQVISSLLEMQAEHTADEHSRKRLLEGKSRINSISLVHEMIYSQDNLANLGMHDYLTFLCNEVKNNLWKEVNGHVEVHCENIELPVSEAIPVGILLNELMTNSFKHARPVNDPLEIVIELEADKDEMTIRYRDNGRNSASSYQHKGMGSTIIESMVRQLHGKSGTIMDGGFNFNLTFTSRKDGKNSHR